MKRAVPPPPAGVPVHRGHSERRRSGIRELAQDYVGMIAELIARNSEARLVDLARGLGVTRHGRPTLRRLQSRGLVTTQPPVDLPDRCRRSSPRCRRRHDWWCGFSWPRRPRALPIGRRGAFTSVETLAAFENASAR
jgi:hypothetical protein